MPDEPDDALSVTRTERDGFVSLEISNARAGQSISAPLDLSGPSPTSPAVSLTSITIESPTVRDRFEVTVSRPAAFPDGPPPIERGVALAYVNVSSTPASNPPIEASVQYGINPVALPEGLGPEDVRVLRYTDDGWTSDAEDGDPATTERSATLPEPGWFVVAALEPGTVEVVDAELEGDWVRSGHETSVRVAVTNTGDRAATRQLTVAVAGEELTGQEVTVQPGETATVRIPFRPSRGGIVTVDGVEVGTIEVSSGNGSTPEDTDPRSGDNVPGFGALAALVALLIVILGARARRE